MTQNVLDRLHDEMKRCTKCLEAGYSIEPGAVFSGKASARLMIIGQAPGVTEAEVKRPFNGTSGTRLFQWLAQEISKDTFVNIMDQYRPAYELLI